MELSTDNEYWKNHQFELELTADGSPTLRSLLSPTQETMHHRGGAYAETQVIYGESVRELFSPANRAWWQGQTPRILSVGLGLGYNEILVAVEAIRQGLRPGQVELVTYESEEVLRQSFLHWCEQAGELAPPVYDLVYDFFSRDPRQQMPEKMQIQVWLWEARKAKKWQLLESLNPEMNIEGKFSLILYDAFSSKTSPHLWSEEFLTRLCTEHTSDYSRLTTYACTGNLKRALKNSGFEVILREGFQSKRNSTLGIKRPVIANNC